MNALANAFELSSSAAALVGPKMRKPRARKMSTAPAASAASGPTTVRSIFSSTAKRASSSRPVIATFFRFGSSAVPALPGATNTDCTRAPCASFQASACSRPPPPMTSTFMTASAAARSLGHLGVVIDGLDVVEVFDDVDQLLHALRVVAGERHDVLRPHRHLGDLGDEPRLLERGLHGLEVRRRRDHLDRSVVVGDDVVGAGVAGGAHHRVFVRPGCEDELAAVAELERDRPFGAEVAAVLAERMANLGDGANAVVGHAVDDDRRAADAVALVSDLLVVHPLEVARRLVDVLLDRVGRHVGSLGLLDGQAQARVHRQVAAALARGADDLADKARPHLAALLVLSTLAVLDVGPLGMTGHVVSR